MTYLKGFGILGNCTTLLIVVHSVQKHEVQVFIRVKRVIVLAPLQVALDAIQTSRFGDDLCRMNEKGKKLDVLLTCKGRNE